MLRKFKSIRFKLVSSIAGFIFLAFIITGIYNFQVSKNEMVNRIENHELPTYVDKMKLEISSQIGKGTLPLEIMINDSYCQQLMKDPDGRTTEIANYLKKFADKYGLWIGFVADKNLTYQMNIGTPRVITKESDSWYFNFQENTKQNREFNVDTDWETGEIKLWVNQKVHDSQGRFLGVAFAGIDINSVKKLVLSANFGQTGSSMMISSTGGIKIHKDSTKLDINNEGETGTSISDLPGLEQLGKKLLNKKNQTIEYDAPQAGTQILITRYIPEFDWYLLINVSKKQIVNPIFKVFTQTLLWGLLITIIVIIISYFALRKSILTPLDKITTVIKQFTEGNLKAESYIKSEDEMGLLAASIKQMQKKLSEIVSQIGQSSETIIMASKEINQSSQQLAGGAHQQAASVEQISTSMEEMLANIHQNTTNSNETEKIAKKAFVDISEVHQSVSDTSKAMRSIANQVQVITEIAGKTDLLAINAAIEAARAGESGKGFAIVAAEVRKLAEKSQTAAIDIEKLIKESVSIAKRSIDLLSAVMPDVEKTTGLVKEISSASQEQNTGAETVNSAILQLNDVAQQNASSAEELATSADVFVMQATNLQKYIGFFDTAAKAKKANENLSSEIADLKSELKKFEKSTKTPENKIKKKKESDTDITSRKTKNPEKPIVSKEEINKGFKLNMDMDDSDFEAF